jgi:very-short-patch-repair endonuclease
VIVPGERSARSRPGIAVHRARDLRPGDITIVRGLPVTTPARTVLDLTERHTPRQVERALDEALALRITSRTKVRELLARSPGRHGVPMLEGLIDPRRPSSRTKSPPEERLLGALRSSGIEQPACNVRIHGWDCDFHFEQAGVVLEFQSYQWHNDKFTFDKDHRKRKLLERHGIEVIHITDEDLEHDLLATLAQTVQTITRRTLERHPGRVRR